MPAAVRSRSPWWWIPTLYVCEGLPYFAVNTLTVILYTNLGLGVAEMALFTGWLYLPWVIKPFWSPFVDILSTRRRWVVAMQWLLCLSMAGVAFALPGPAWLAMSLVCFWLMAFASATHDIAADGYYMLALTDHQQAAFVGVRSTFYRVASVIGQGGMVMLGGWLEVRMGSVPRAWSLVFVVLSLFFLATALWHSRVLPRPAADVDRHDTSAREILRNFGATFVTFFRKPQILRALAFMLLYRLPEALCLKLTQPFMLAPRASGGLGLSTQEVGFANGTVGVIALLAGGILGGLAIASKGLKRCLWPMALALTLPCALYLWMACVPQVPYWAVCLSIGVEQFGYGFGFTAFMLYLIYFSQGDHKTSHYAFCTAFMALGMMLPGMLAGYLFEALALLTPTAYSFLLTPYATFFLFVLLTSVATFLATALIRVPSDFGLKSSSR